ncbi:MAG: hypothetical protein JW754_04270 [Candidatus Aenigmarchaeota archaeon]|nr:hypothetical protein [Candidatus Aenigmarchaeota archaeon]
MRCSFTLNRTEYNVMIFMLKTDGIFSVSKISKTMKLDRTTVQKAIKNLVCKKLAKRRQKNLPNGGYTFFYEINNKKEIKNRMKEITYKWYKSVEKSIDNL